MAVTIYGLIQHRRGIKADLPVQLEEGELGFCVDTRELFIGNTPAQGGNTQIFTDSSDVVQLAQYEFVSDTQVPSQTGMSMSQPVVRSLQAQLDDAWVNVKAYGAQGDGITDDTASINRAIQDLYTKQLTTSENVRQARKTVWFPSGRYLIQGEILLYPEVHLQGENYQNTQLFKPTDATLNDQLIRLCDSRGQTGANLGQMSAQMPVRQSISHLNLHVQNATQIVLLERPDHVEFNHCWFTSVWQGPSVVPGSEITGILLDALGGTIYGDVWINNCVFNNMEWGIYCDQPLTRVHVFNCEFKSVYLGIITDGAPGPTHVKIQNTLFQDVTNYALKVQSTSHVSSLHNTYMNVNSGSPAILWAATTSLCVSMADQFDVVPGIQDLGSQNLILNSQQTNVLFELQVTSTTQNQTYYPMLSDVQTGASDPVTSSLFTFNPNPVAPVFSVQGEMRTQGIVQNYREDTVSASISLTHTDQILGAGPGATVLLPTTPTNGKTYTIKDVVGTAAANAILITPTGGASVDNGAANSAFPLNINWGSVTLMYKTSGNQWLIL